MRASSDEERAAVELPYIYTVYLWRRRFGESYLNAMATPLDVMTADFEMLSLENEFTPQERTPKDGRA